MNNEVYDIENDHEIETFFEPRAAAEYVLEQLEARCDKILITLRAATTDEMVAHYAELAAEEWRMTAHSGKETNDAV